VGLGHRETGPVVDFDPVAFGIKEIQSEGVSVADDSLDLDILGFQRFLVAAQIIDGGNLEGGRRS